MRAAWRVSLVVGACLCASACASPEPPPNVLVLLAVEDLRALGYVED